MRRTSLAEKRNFPSSPEIYSWGVTQNGQFYPFIFEKSAKEIAKNNEDLSAYFGFPLADCHLDKEDA
jgi:hypothetical protein